MGKTVVSRCRDPRWNLALEEYLMEREENLLYLWRNEPSVIIGRNQNPYAECSPSLLQQRGIHLVRRKSGGGAVYHDPGNLNITLVSPSTQDAPEKNFLFLRQTLEDLGISAQVSGRNDLEVQGKKVSGSAFYESDGRLCHHCTMLVSTDFSAMGDCLTPSRLKLASRGIDSVRSRVGNLSEFRQDLTVEMLASALIRRAGGECRYLSPEQLAEIPEITKKAERYGSFSWNFGESPGADLRFEGKFPWGLVTVELAAAGGKIKSCRIYTDSLQTEGFEDLASRLEGTALEKNALAAVLLNGTDPTRGKDLLSLIEI